MQTVATASRADQTRALSLSTIAFTACFAVWTIFSIIGVAIKAELGLNDTQFGLLVATPILTGSITRLFLGVWTEKYGGRLVFSSQMILTALATWALTLADSYIMYLVAALGIGLAGGSFIIGVAYVSRWYDAGRQGTALGIFGAGQCRRGGHQVRRSLRHGRLRLARRRLCLGGWRLPSSASCSSCWPRTTPNWSNGAGRGPRRPRSRSSSRR